MTIRNRISFASSIVLLLGVLAVEVFGQTRDQIKTQAETALQKMSPEEIDRKLRELGISRDQAIRRAAEVGISLEEYLSKPQPTETPAGAQLAPVSVPRIDQTPIIRVEVPVEVKVPDVPGFVGRRGAGGLKPFGYDIFQYPASTFEPVLNVATPPSYVLGPGDEIIINVWGETKLYHQLVVNREGNVIIPDVGPVNANGLSIHQFREKLLRRMTAVYSGLRGGAAGANTFLDVSLGKLRTIQVFVLGEMIKPGGYALSSMSTAFHALYLSGGPKISGTLRQIQVVRSGFSIPPIDFYNYALRGDNSKDVRLQDGDIVFIKPVHKRVAISGKVSRPALYELKKGETLGDLVSLSGDLRFDAYFKRVHVERIVPFEERNKYEKDVLDLDLTFVSLKDLQESKFGLEDGDVVMISGISDLPEHRVIISGNVKKSGPYQLRAGMRIKDLIMAADSLDRDSFLERGTLLRLLPNLRQEIYEFNVRKALLGEEASNLELRNEDSVVVYKESQFFPQRQVSIAGAVRNPGRFPRYEKMTVADLVVLAGGLTETASFKEWEVSRVETTSVGVFSRIYKIAVDSTYWRQEGNAAFRLEDLDHVLVSSDPRITLPQVVHVQGHVMFPGTYAIRFDGEKISDAIKRAGGLKEGSYLLGAHLFRKRNDAGFVPIDFEEALKNLISNDNLVLVDQDSIYIPRFEELVYVRGEVFVPSPVLYKKGESLKYYIKQAGGYKDEADDGRTVVFLPTGKKWESGWFIFPDPEILPGSAIFVPKKVEKEDKTLPIIRDMVTILASLAALTVALVQVTK